MCGIAGLILKIPTGDSLVPKLKALSKLLEHRGPDGEGFLLADSKKSTPYFDQFPPATHQALNYIPSRKIPENGQSSTLGFVHRRLSILDLSERGHQPMCDRTAKLWITYNGEVYNYRELRQELENAGYQFISESDTEVILNAYREWGEKCVEKFNGMWAFCIYDSEKNICFASRDRLGVKPFYYTNTSSFFAFASEQKALVGAGLVKAKVNEKALHNYLVNVQLENETQNFFEDIQELWPGHNLTFHFKSKALNVTCYYSLNNHLTLENNALSDEALIDKIASAVHYSVQIRLRSDVEVGTCLSGGIDSSAIAMSIAEITQHPFHCFTSVFRNSSINEEHFADIVALKTGAKHNKIEPTLNGFISELDELIYSQDIPIWDTSTYAQFKVMALAKETGIKVVLDGQGADELFGGYHHHFLATWNHYFSTGKLKTAFQSIQHASDSIPHPFVFFLKERVKQMVDVKTQSLSGLLKKEFIAAHPVSNPSQYFNDLNQQLIHDIYKTRLKSFLKCEDRCGMWHSVESRVPFSDDVELINLMFSFDPNRKIQKGTSKYLLREALKSKLPKEIYERKDKKGFETPSKDWLKKLRPEMITEILESDLNFIQNEKIKQFNSDNEHQNKLLFRLFIFCRWKKRFAA
jgi:asparagine synthase (glutamine-hydrolysing)